MLHVTTRASNEPLRSFTITEKAPTRAFNHEKAPARAFNQEKVLVGAFVSSSSDDTLVRVVKQIIAEPSRTGAGRLEMGEGRRLIRVPQL